MFVEHKEQGEPHREPQVKLPITKLSQAIREGAKISPQCRNGLYIDDDGKTCAIGAAFRAMGYLQSASGYYAANQQGNLFDRLVQTFGFPEVLHREITSRNDSGQSREEIADWLESKGY